MFVISLTGNEFMVCICNVICLSSHWHGMNLWYIYAMSYVCHLTDREWIHGIYLYCHMFVISLTGNEFMVCICNVICLSSHWQGMNSWYIYAMSYMFVISLTRNEFMVYICNVIICLSSHWQGVNSWYISVLSYICHLTEREWIWGIYL